MMTSRLKPALTAAHTHIVIHIHSLAFVPTYTEKTRGPMSGFMDRWIDGWMDGWMDGWTDGRTDGRTDGWMGGWVDVWMDE